MINIDMSRYKSVLQVFDESCARFTDRPAFTCMGKMITYGQLEEKSRYFAAYLQNHTDLKEGDRIAIQLPNTLMFPVAVFGVLRAGLIVVNTNPLYSEREMEHQFNDSGARAIVVLANMAHSVQKLLKLTCLKHVFVTELGDMHPFIKRHAINKVVKYVKKMVPAYHLPHAIPFRKALHLGRKGHWAPTRPTLNGVAILQYTGGTTGVAKGAMLTHKNLVANMLQARGVIDSLLNEGGETIVAPLPMYHIYTFTVNCMVMMAQGNHSLLITNPRDLPAFVKVLKNNHFTCFVGLNTLFVALCNRDDFKALNFSSLKLTISGGMALTKIAAEQWEEVTGCAIAEGYGLTETSPVATFNPPAAIQLGSIGKPVASTELKVIDINGETLAQGESGELCIRGPQVMQGYWQQPTETAKVLTADGWFMTGDKIGRASCRARV